MLGTIIPNILKIKLRRTASMTLAEWARHFLKHQDIMKREILDIEERSEGACTILIVKKKNGQEDWYIAGALDDAVKHVDGSRRQGIVCFNSKVNLKSLIQHWKIFAAHPTLKIVFAHPPSNERWVLVPNHHNRVADDDALALGLESLFSTVTEYNG